MCFALAAILFGEMRVIYFSLTELLVLCHRALHHSPARRNGWVHQSQWIYTYSINITSSLCQFVIRLVLGMQSLLHDAIFLHFSLLFADQRFWFQWNKWWRISRNQSDCVTPKTPVLTNTSIGFIFTIAYDVAGSQLSFIQPVCTKKERRKGNREREGLRRLSSGLYKHPQLILHFWSFLVLTMREKTLENNLQCWIN